MTNPANCAVANSSPNWDLMLEANGRWGSAKCLLSICLGTFTRDINFAAESLAISAENLLNQATANHDRKAAEEAHAEMWRAASILEYITEFGPDGEELFALHGIHMIMTRAIELLNSSLANTGVTGGAA